MKAVKIFTALLILAFGIQTQGYSKGISKILKKKGPVYDFEMKSMDSLDKDVMKILPAKSTLAHPVTQGVFGPADGSKGSILIVPYTTGKGKVELMLLIPMEIGKYKKMLLGEISFQNMKSLEISAVFFDQADKEKERELFILCLVNSQDYQTAVYSWKKTKFVRLPAIEPKLTGLYPSLVVRRALPEIVNQSNMFKGKR